jgi:hypothetical protein
MYIPAEIMKHYVTELLEYLNNSVMISIYIIRVVFLLNSGREYLCEYNICISAAILQTKSPLGIHRVWTLNPDCAQDLKVESAAFFMIEDK